MTDDEYRKERARLLKERQALVDAQHAADERIKKLTTGVGLYQKYAPTAVGLIGKLLRPKKSET